MRPWGSHNFINIILAMSVNLEDESNIKSVDWVKQMVRRCVRALHPNSWRTKRNQKWNKGFIFILFLPFSFLYSPTLSTLYLVSLLIYKVRHWCSLVFKLLVEYASTHWDITLLYWTLHTRSPQTFTFQMHILTLFSHNNHDNSFICEHIYNVYASAHRPDSWGSHRWSLTHF